MLHSPERDIDPILPTFRAKIELPQFQSELNERLDVNFPLSARKLYDTSLVMIGVSSHGYYNIFRH